MTARIFGRALEYACIVALLALIAPSEVWAHRCGPETLKVNKGDTVAFAITGSDFIEYQIIDKGNPLVAKIEPPMNNDEYDVVFKIVGTGQGVTKFKIVWDGPSRRGVCYPKVTVEE